MSNYHPNKFDAGTLKFTNWHRAVEILDEALPADPAKFTRPQDWRDREDSLAEQFEREILDEGEGTGYIVVGGTTLMYSAKKRVTSASYDDEDGWSEPYDEECFYAVTIIC